jgi:DNA polymerase-3 subunit alpha
MITQAKRIRTKKGDWMMFATLDDLDAAVEILVFGKAMEASGDALALDSIVLVRGRVDHKDRDKTCVVVQDVTKFEPSPEEVRKAVAAAAKAAQPPPPLELSLDATALPAGILDELKEVLAGCPGESDVVIQLATSKGRRRLKLGPAFRVARTAGLHAELDALLGAATVRHASAPA